MARVIDPLTIDEFFADYYESKPFVLNRGTSDYFSSLLSFGDLDEVLGSLSLRYPSIKFVKTEGKLKRRDFTYDGASKIDPVKAARLFEDGYTIIFPHLHERLPALRRFCSSMGQYFSSHIQTNIYLTPPASQGFRPHWDTHDVFILQVSGRKRWRFYDTKFELPLRGQAFDPDNPEHEAGAVSREFVMEAGDSIYIPRGLMHAAETMDETSLHITTGLMFDNWAKVLLGIVSKRAEQNVELRRTVPVGFARPEFSAEDRKAVLEKVVAELVASIDCEDVFEGLADRLVSKHRPVLDDLLRQARRAGEATIETEVRKRIDALYLVVRKDEQIVIKAYGNEIAFPDFAASAVEAALARERFVVRDLPGELDDDGKLVLVKRLLREGLLVRDLD